MNTAPCNDSRRSDFPRIWGVSLALTVLSASACDPTPGALTPEPVLRDRAAALEDANSTNKVLILGSSVSGGLLSREALAVASVSHSTAIDVVTPEQWKAMTPEQFMTYRALIIGDAACQSGTAAFQAAVESRDKWGIIVDGDVALLSTDPTFNETPLLVESAIRYVLNSVQKRTGMYIALGCAYQQAPAGTAVTLLQPFGTFQVQGVPGCADSAHSFGMWNDLISRDLSDELLPGNGCAARSVFTTYPDHTFSFAAIAMSSSGAPVPGQRSYVDYLYVPEVETTFIGTPYLLVRGAETLAAGCGLSQSSPDEECDMGDDLNGMPAVQGQHPWDTCSFSCHLHWCGDGFVDVDQGEECDQGVDNGRSGTAGGAIGTCTSFCKLVLQAPPPHPPHALCQNVTVVADYTCGVAASIDNGSYDPDGDLVGCTQTPAGPYPIGSTPVSLGCVDQRGLTDSCTGTVTVLDHVVPTLVLNGPESPSVECTQGGAYFDPGATANDLCDGPLEVVRTGQVRAGAPAEYPLRYDVTDSAGNSPPPVRRLVGVTDTLAPNLLLAGLDHESLECGTPYVDPGAMALDQCAGDLTQAIKKSGAVNHQAPGSYTLHYNVKDPAGHDAVEATRVVTVVDTLPPSLTLAEPLNMQLECGAAGYVDPGATATDACAGSLPAVPSTVVDPNVPGSYSIRYTATDPSGNTAVSTARRTVTVHDTLPPVLALLGPSSTSLECGTPYNDPGAMASDQCAGDLTSAIVRAGAVNPWVPGRYTLAYSVVDPSGNGGSVHREVDVSDTLPPSLALEGARDLSFECGSAYVDPGAKATDACAGDVSARILVTGAVNPGVPGTYTLSYSVTDPSGNLATAAWRTVTVTDRTAPRLSLNGPSTLTLECGAPYRDPGATATDDCAGDLSVGIERSGSLDPRTPGSYTLHYSVSDPSGQVATMERAVTVVDTQRPDILCPEPITQEVLEADEASVTPEEARATDECDLAPRVSHPSQTRFPVGTTSLTYTATDASGNTASCTTTITVLRIALPDTWIVSGPPGETEDTNARFEFDASKPDVTYECSLEGSSFSECSKLTAFSELAQGPHMLLVRARDTRGNVDPTPAQATWMVLPPPIDWDRAVLGGGNGCAQAGGDPSGLAMVGLALVLLCWRRQHLRGSTRATGRLLGAVTALLATTSSAQVRKLPPFEMERASLNPSATGSLLLGTGELLPDDTWRFSLTGHYENNPLVFVQNGEQLGTVVRYRATAHLAAAYGVKDWLELGVQVPLLLAQRGDDLTAWGLASPEQGPALGTPMLTLRWRLLAERHEDPVDLSVGVQAGPRLGRADALARELRAIPSIMVGRRQGFLRGALDAGILLRPRTILTPDAKIQDELGYSLRLGAMLATTGEVLRAETAVIAGVPLRREGHSLELLAGLRLPLSATLETYGLAGVGYGTAPGTPDFRVLLGVAYARIPIVRPGREETAREELPPPDGDHDGVLDGDDACPREPGSAAEKGCPPRDTDEDGLLDGQDACPQVAGLPELNGCPPVDTDGDTLPDEQDNCPCQPGPASNEGCPEKEKQLVAIEPDRIALKETIYFDFDKDTIQPRSFPLLDQMASVLQEHPNILSVLIEGHTDDKGPDDYNLDLSQRRAEAVREYLAGHGVERERMEARGFGESRPLESNATPEGRAINRRVEFMTRSAEPTP